MGVSVLLRFFVSSNEFCSAAYAVQRIHKQNSIFKYTTIGPMIPKEMKYNLHCCDVRGYVLSPPHCTNTSCSVVKLSSKRLPLETKNTLRIRKWES